MDRPDKDRYFLDIALSVAARSTCTRRKFGAVIVKDSTIVGTGYNGTARGVVNCYEVGCIKDEMESPQGAAYDYCPAVHAEENAIINSNRSDRIRRHTLHCWEGQGWKAHDGGSLPDGAAVR